MLNVYAEIVENHAEMPEMLQQAIEEISEDEGMTEAQVGAMLISSYFAHNTGSDSLQDFVRAYMDDCKGNN